MNTKLQVDITLEIGEQTEQVTVSESAVQVETQSTQMGDVVTGSVMTAVALNGRAFTDLCLFSLASCPCPRKLPIRS